MGTLESWGPRYNQQPELHLRLTIDTKIDPNPVTVLALAGAIVETLRFRGFHGITLVHAGRGSTTVEVSVAREQAEIAKLQAESDKLRAETRFTNVKTLSAAGAALYAAALSMGFDVASATGAVGEMVREIALECEATECRLQVGEENFSVGIPADRPPHTATGEIQPNEQPLSELFIWQGSEVRQISAVELPSNLHMGSKTIVIGALRNSDSLRPIIRNPNGDFVLRGLKKLLPVTEGAIVSAELVVDTDGAFYPVRIEVVGANDGPI